MIKTETETWIMTLTSQMSAHENGLELKILQMTLVPKVIEGSSATVTNEHPSMNTINKSLDKH